MKESKRKIGDIVEYVDEMYEALIDADALVIMTEWSEFRMPKFKIIEKLLKNKLIFYGRNIYDQNELKKEGWNYFSIGRIAN